MTGLPPDGPGASATVDGGLMVCASHASIVFETALNGAVTRRARSGCFDEGASGAATALVERVLARLPACEPVVERHRRRAAFLTLDVCAGFEGDLEAAGEAWVRYADLRDAEHPRDAAPSAAFFSPDVRLVTPTGAYRGRGAVAANWRSVGWYFADRLTGASTTLVTVAGIVERSIEPEDAADTVAADERAPFTQQWTKRGGEWRLDEMQVGAFTVHRRYDDPPSGGS